MRSFESYFDENEIIYYLCKLRARVAKQRSKKHIYHLLTENSKYNYHRPQETRISEYQNNFLCDLNKIMPPRKIWKELPEESRYKITARGKKIRITTVDKNIYSLLNTIKYYKEKKPKEPFLINLKIFIKEIQATIKRKDYVIAQPIIFPKPKLLKRISNLKPGEKNTCRPISLFGLKDRLILSFTNKFLTQLIDPYFLECSLAFRASQNGEIKTHHDAVKKILEFKENCKAKELWVGECDMQKFYDSVNHKIILRSFNSFIKKAKEDNPTLDLSLPINIFYKYLQCYSFNKIALPLNKVNDYWEKHKIDNGQFGWVSDDLKLLNYYNKIPFWGRWFYKKVNTWKLFNRLNKYEFCIESENIGIPQGGALSGLIANIVLDHSDRETLTIDKIFYIRFCDDMILMSPEKDVCDRSLTRYQRSLKKLKLVPHPFSDNLSTARTHKKAHLPELSFRQFWNEKSKGPYKWCSAKEGGFPWVGFVGYEINYEGLVRVRKSSVEKEYKKQIEIANKLRKAIRVGKKVNNGSISESAIHQLIGMSVGRVQIWSYEETDNEMCWKNGFKALTVNKHSIKQLKFLDRSRNKIYSDFKKELHELYEDCLPPKEKRKRQIIAFNKPFSYYYHFVDKPE
jgi:hypothetical protein